MTNTEWMPRKRIIIERVEGDLSGVPSYAVFLDLEHYGDPILDKAEKRYLKCVIKPFRNKVHTIVKRWNNECQKRGLGNASIRGYAEDGKLVFRLPFFDGTKMYTGMEPNRRYSLEELGL